MKSRLALGVAVGLGLTLLQPALADPEADTSRPSSQGEAGEVGRRGGTLFLSAYGSPGTFNPTLVAGAYEQRILSLAFDSLLDENGITNALEPALAERWEVGPDGRTYTFHLRRGATWHDGQALTADDVVFTWMTVLRNADIPWEDRGVIAVNGELPTVTKLDAHTVRFSLPTVFAPFLRMAGGLKILPRHIFEPWVKEKGPDGKPLANSQWHMECDVSQIVGSGPFRFVTHELGRRLELVRHPHYYRVDREGGRLPYLDRLVFQFYDGPESSLQAFEAGELDYHWVPGAEDSRVRQQADAGNFVVREFGPDFRTSYLTFNLNPGRAEDGTPYIDPVKLRWFTDTRFRQALSYGIDREAIIRIAYRGHAVRQSSPVFQKSPYYDPSTPAYPYDHRRAVQLLEEAGFRLRGGSLFDGDGHPVTFELLVDDGGILGVQVANLVRMDLAVLGIDLKVVPVPFHERMRRTHESKDWESVMGSWGAGVDPQGVAHLWKSTGESHIFNLEPSPKRHKTYPWERTIDILFERAATTLDERERKRLYSEFQQVVGREQPMIFLPVFTYAVATRNTIGNWRPSASHIGGPTWNIYELYRRDAVESL